MKYQWILFDADNTLFDYDRAERQALGNALVDQGIALTGEHLDRYHRINKAAWDAFEKGEIDREVLRFKRFEDLLIELGSPADSRQVAADYLAYLGAAAFLIEGAEALLTDLREHYRLGLVTNGLKEVQRPRLRRSGLGDYFEVVIISEEIGHFKPEPGFFEYTHHAIRKPARGQVLVVGDNLNADIKGAMDFGMDACWYNPKRLPNTLGVSATAEVTSFTELHDWLQVNP